MTPKHQTGLLRRINARFEKKLMGFGTRTNISFTHNVKYKN